MVKYSEFSPSLFVFPAVLFPTCATLVLCALYGSLALWLIRAVLQELRVSREARRKTSKGTGRTREPTSHGSSHTQDLTTRAHVLCIVCAASIFSFGYGALKFVPTLVHIVLHDEVFTVCVSIGYRLLGAAADSLWFFASSQLVAYWLELLTSMRSVKRVRKCCWFSIATALPFTLLRTAAAIAAPLTHPSVHVTLIVAAVGIAWILVAVGIASGLKLACHMRRLVAKNRAAKIVRAKMSRTGRFLAINLALFVLLSLALVLAAVGRVMTSAAPATSPLAYLAWEAPTRACRFIFFASLAWSCTASSTRATARGAIVKTAKTAAIKTHASLAHMRERAASKSDPGGRRSDGGNGGEEEDDEAVVYDLSLVTSSPRRAEATERVLNDVTFLSENPLPATAGTTTKLTWAQRAQKALIALMEGAALADHEDDGSIADDGTKLAEPLFELRVPSRRDGVRSASAPVENESRHRLHARTATA